MLIPESIAALNRICSYAAEASETCRLLSRVAADESLRRRLEARANEHGDLATYVARTIAGLGHSPELHRDEIGQHRRIVVAATSWLTHERDERISAEVIASELTLKSAINAALELDVPDETRPTLTRHLDETKSALPVRPRDQESPGLPN